MHLHMPLHLLKHHKPSTNGAPQTIAATFAALLPFTMLFPIFEITYDGAAQPYMMAEILKTDAGFNIFALMLIFVPVVGIAVAYAAKSAWRIATMMVALSGVALVILSLARLTRGLRGIADGLQFATLGAGGYILLAGYGLLALITGFLAFKDRNT